MNINIDTALKLLEPIKSQHGDSLSWSDLIILAGNTALETAAGDNSDMRLSFCPGRVDDNNGQGWESLEPTITGNFSESLVTLKVQGDLC